MNSSTPQSTSNWFELVLRFLETHGYPKDMVLAELGISPELPGSAKFFPVSQLSELWLYAYEKFGTMVGIMVAEHFKPHLFSDVGLLLQSCKNLDEFLKRICQFIPLISTAISLEYADHNAHEKKLKINFKEIVTLQVERLEMCLLCGWKMANLLHETGFNFLRLEHIRPKPLDITAWVNIFGPNVIWGQAEFVIYFSNEEVYRQTKPVNESISKVLENELSLKLNQLYSKNYSHRVKNEIANLLGQQQATLNLVAQKLNISNRSLQRHLEDEGYTFRTLLNQVQMQKAQNYLHQTNLSLFEISLLTGFSSPSNFSLAFKRWTGKTPGYYREFHKI